MLRRDFIKKGVSGIALGAMGPTLLKGVGFVNETIQMAAIGCGRQGRNNILNFIGLEEKTGSRFVAVCDVDLKRARETAELIEARYLERGIKHRVRVYETAAELLADPGIDAVQIVTPDHSHAQLAIAAAEAGKDIYLEKPLTYTIAEGRDLVKAVRRNKRILQTGTQQRSSVYFHTVCQLAVAGRLGAIKAVEVRIPTDHWVAEFAAMPVPDGFDYKAWLGNAPEVTYTEKGVHPQADYSRPGWMQIEAYGHGMIANWGAHMLDIAQWGLEMDDSGPEFVSAEAVYEERGLWDVYTQITGTSRYRGDIEVRLVAIERGSELRPGVRFIGTDAWADADRGAFNASDRELLRWRPGPEDPALSRSRGHYLDFLQAVRSREDPIAPVEVGHRSNTVCILHAISTKLGRPVHWDPAKETFIDDPEADRYLSDMRL